MPTHGRAHGNIDGNIALGRIAPHFMLVATFKRYPLNGNREGELCLTEAVCPKDGESLVRVSRIDLGAVSQMMKNLGFKKITSLPRDRKYRTVTYRWINFESSNLH